MTRLYVFDLDGTLANIKHRVHYIKNKNKNYKKFYEECVHDKPNQWVIDLLNTVTKANGNATNYFNQSETLVLSGRSEEVEEETREWLRKYNVFYDYLILRPKNNYTPDYKLKKELLENFLLDKDFEVQFIVEDRQSVVDMWRKNGYNVLQCDKWTERKGQNNE